MDTRQLEAFLVLTEELHFGRTAMRLHLTPARISQLVGKLERQIGEPLFVRNSRRVELLASGEALLAEVGPPYRQLQQAVSNATQRARGRERTLRVAYMLAAGMGRVHTYVAAFERANPGVCVATLPFDELARFAEPVREGDADVLLLWMPGPPTLYDGLEPDLRLGPILATSPRVMAVGPDHPWARQSSVDIEELPGYDLVLPAPRLPNWFMDNWIPPVTPAGRPIRRRAIVAESGMDQVVDRIIRSRVALATTASIADTVLAPGINLVPLRGLQSAHLTALWLRGTHSALIERFLDAAGRVSHTS
ncbi:LysR family transcriptional regulator [Nocardia sp. CDC159]|uniref:LysR family transcriptional regulator n=1 Tax=Nocardia pulmonis TaxID=2951408 RepID=A0A9X2IYQ1_9NOCA|nr:MULTISPECIES: LysR family transcriptional regulator [Nocardia]MCM6775899.1 LysR family transcriptional regulator [Nocardia pulmonis]MCM6788125.1 LysR family transcriptional regulator [Nocardia sp. CDC159]